MPFLSYPEQVGFDKGEKVGLDKGERLGLLRALETLLRVKFQAEGVALMPLLQERESSVLLQVLETLGTEASLDEVRRLLP
jgi:hypothetical protein